MSKTRLGGRGPRGWDLLRVLESSTDLKDVLQVAFMLFLGSVSLPKYLINPQDYVDPVQHGLVSQGWS